MPKILIYMRCVVCVQQKACTRIFWKTEAPGRFSRDHREILLKNGWDHLSQEVLISTPRRFGKTISVSMFAAAMLFSAPRIEISIYSTCKRISQKLLRNVQKFFMEIIDQDYNKFGFKVIRQNMEEIVLQGPDGVNDVRIVNSYPSKVIYYPSQKSALLKYKSALLNQMCMCMYMYYIYIYIYIIIYYYILIYIYIYTYSYTYQ